MNGGRGEELVYFAIVCPFERVSSIFFGTEIIHTVEGENTPVKSFYLNFHFRD